MLLRLREDPQGASGRLTLRVRKNGRLLYEDVERNVLTNAGKIQWLQRLKEGSTVLGIDRMEVGDGGCDPSALSVPIPFTATDTDLRSTVGLTASLEPDPIVNVGTRTITYRAILSSALVDDENFHYADKVINEIALRTASPDNVAFALRAFKSISFGSTDAMEIEAEWEVTLV